MPVQPGAPQYPADLRWDGGQAQEPAEQPGPAAGADQHGEPAGVAEAHPGQVDDQPAGAGPEQAQELLAQAGDTGNV